MTCQHTAIQGRQLPLFRRDSIRRRAERDRRGAGVEQEQLRLDFGIQRRRRAGQPVVALRNKERSEEEVEGRGAFLTFTFWANKL